jgi:hypothetical protein
VIRWFWRGEPDSTLTQTEAREALKALTADLPKPRTAREGYDIADDATVRIKRAQPKTLAAWRGLYDCDWRKGA